MRSQMNSLEPGSHMLAKKTAYLFYTDFRLFCLSITRTITGSPLAFELWKLDCIIFQIVIQSNSIDILACVKFVITVRVRIKIRNSKPSVCLVSPNYQQYNRRLSFFDNLLFILFSQVCQFVSISVGFECRSMEVQVLSVLTHQRLFVNHAHVNWCFTWQSNQKDSLIDSSVVGCDLLYKRLLQTYLSCVCHQIH